MVAGMWRAVLGVLITAVAAAQDFSDIHVEKVGAGFVFTEGPAWSKENYLLFSDVAANKIWKLTVGEKNPISVRENSGGAAGNAFDAKGSLYTCETRGRRVIRMDKKGTVEVLADKYEGKRLNAPNDIAVRKDGQVYFTDPAFGNQADTRELDFYGVYHIPPKGPLTLIAKPKGRPNGIALSPNGRTLYVTNSDQRNVYAYDLDGKGVPSNERVFIPKIDGIPDGLRTDEKGNLYIAARKLVIYSPEGKLIHEIEISETPHNLTFGDGDLQTLYVTAHSSVYRIRLNVKGAVQY